MDMTHEDVYPTQTIEHRKRVLTDRRLPDNISRSSNGRSGGSGSGNQRGTTGRS
jgi:hypothetical protein